MAGIISHKPVSWQVADGKEVEVHWAEKGARKFRRRLWAADGGHAATFAVIWYNARMKLLFVCHGNICRSPMAEFVMKDMLAKAGRDDVVVESAALHTDELGNDIHYGTKRELSRHGIPFSPRRAWLLSASKLREYDLAVGMDGANMHDLRRLAGASERPRLCRLLDFAGIDRDVADPWYTGDFESTYADVVAGCSALLKEV